MNALFNFVSQMTDQGIHLLGMLTEAIHTPFMQDRFLALENAKYVMNNMADLGEEVEFRKDGVIVKRAHAVLEETVAFLEKIDETGPHATRSSRGSSPTSSARATAARGSRACRKKADGYWNPFETHLQRELGL